MIKVLKKIIPLTLAIAITSISAKAQSNQIIIPVHANFKPLSAVGVVMAPSGSIEIEETKIEKKSEDQYLVKFNLNQEASDDFSTTAYVTSETGEIAYGNVKPVIRSSYDSAILNLPTCQEKEPPLSLSSRMGLIENLVRVRTELRSNKKVQLKKLFDSETIEKFSKLESGFGYDTDPKLSLELAPDALVDRLSKILNSLKKYRAHGPKK